MTITLLHIDGITYTPNALRELLALIGWAKRKRATQRRADQAYEARHRERRNAQRRGGNQE